MKTKEIRHNNNKNTLKKKRSLSLSRARALAFVLSINLCDPKIRTKQFWKVTDAVVDVVDDDVVVVVERKIQWGCLCHQNDERDEKDDEDGEYLDHEPAIGCNGLEVLEQLAVRLRHVQVDVVDVGVDALDGLVLLLNHAGQLLEHAAEFNNRLLDGLHGVGALAQEHLLFVDDETLLQLLLLHEIHVEYSVTASVAN